VIFAHPTAFFALVPLALLAALVVAAFRRKDKNMKALGDPATLARLVDPFSPRHQRVKALLSLAGILFLLLSIAGPRWGQKFQEMRRRGVDVIVALDLSTSMMAEDVKPNRLVQAKRELGLLIGGLSGDRVGVVAFAGKAFLQCPLTLDYGAARLLLNLLDVDAAPVQGTSLAAAIETACDAFQRNERKHKALVLLTDGEDHSKELKGAVARAQEQGVRIFAVGFGSPEGEIIPVRDEAGNLVEYKKDKFGKTVVTKLDEAGLKDIAQATGGQYYRATSGEIEVERLLSDIERMEKKSLESKIYDAYEDRYDVFLWIALLLLALEFFWPEVSGHFRALGRAARRAFLLIPLLLLPLASHALGRFPGREPRNPVDQYNAANALYKRKNFKEAADLYEKAQADPKLAAQGAYNAGNAHFRQGEMEKAVEKYKQALRANPDDLDAKHNLEFVQKVMAEQKKQQNQKPKEGDKKPDQNKQPSGGGGDQEKQEQQKSSGDQRKMSKEDAERLLQAVEGQEKAARKKQGAPPKNEMEQDW